MSCGARLSVVVALAVFSCLGCGTALEVDNHDPAHPTLGQRAPLFTTTTLDEGVFDLARHIGKDVVILDFWATWCPPCVKSLPTLSEVAAEYEDRGVEFFAVDIGETPEDVRQFLDDTSLKLDVVMDPDGAISDLYQVEPIPHTVIIGRDGIIRWVHIGMAQNLRAELTHELDALVRGD